jgi:transposase
MEYGHRYPAYATQTVAAELERQIAIHRQAYNYTLNVKGMLQGDGNARNKQNAAWRQFIALLEYKVELYGTHVVQAETKGTTKECASCGVETPNPIWVREHSCPSCGFECDYDRERERIPPSLGGGRTDTRPV